MQSRGLQTITKCGAGSLPTSVTLVCNRRSMASHSQAAGGEGGNSTSSMADPSNDQTTNLTWRDKFASFPIFSKHKMTRNGNNFDTLPAPRLLSKFKFHNRFFYAAPFRTQKMENFVKIENGQLLSMSTVYQHEQHPDICVTLVPLSHAAHPQFYYQVDLVLCQHDSVLMEGRVPYKQAPFSTLVPPRPLPNQIRPVGITETTQSWEPNDMTAFWQPYSWGVKDSPNYTVIHAADKYDYEKLPLLASLRWNMPLLGSFQREVHCLSMIPFLVDNGYKKFAIPWGAAHMPIMHEMLENNGFRVVSVSALPIFDEADGEISHGYVRTNAKLLAKAESRDDLWFATLCVMLSASIIYYTGKIELDGVDYISGQPTEVDDKTFAKFGRAPQEGITERLARQDTSAFIKKFT